MEPDDFPDYQAPNRDVPFIERGSNVVEEDENVTPPKDVMTFDRQNTLKRRDPAERDIPEYEEADPDPQQQTMQLRAEIQISNLGMLSKIMIPDDNGCTCSIVAMCGEGQSIPVLSAMLFLGIQQV